MESSSKSLRTPIPLFLLSSMRSDKSFFAPASGSSLYPKVKMRDSGNITGSISRLFSQQKPGPAEVHESIGCPPRPWIATNLYGQYSRSVISHGIFLTCNYSHLRDCISNLNQGIRDQLLVETLDLVGLPRADYGFVTSLLSGLPSERTLRLQNTQILCRQYDKAKARVL